jgi:hypothetical protein
MLSNEMQITSTRYNEERQGVGLEFNKDLRPWFEVELATNGLLSSCLPLLFHNSYFSQGGTHLTLQQAVIMSP